MEKVQTRGPENKCKQEGNGPIIPASTRAMRNRHEVLYDINYPSKYITPNDLGGHMGSDLKSATGIHVHIAFNGLRGHGGLQKTKEVI